MAKIDKSLYSKTQIQKLLEQRRKDKLQQTVVQANPHMGQEYGFVLGNGTSRNGISPAELQNYGKVYGCNALYREFKPDYLVAVDVKMILEIAESNWQLNNEVWTNSNKAYKNIEGLNYFNPSKGWSSGPTALWLASQHKYKKIYILGFDYKGLNNGRSVNNVYADTPNYKKSDEIATYYGNWLRQTLTVVKENPQTVFYRVIASDNFILPELNKFNNLKHISVEDFKKTFKLS